MFSSPPLQISHFSKKKFFGALLLRDLVLYIFIISASNLCPFLQKVGYHFLASMRSPHLSSEPLIVLQDVTAFSSIPYVHL